MHLSKHTILLQALFGICLNLILVYSSNANVLVFSSQQILQLRLTCKKWIIIYSFSKLHCVFVNFYDCKMFLFLLFSLLQLYSTPILLWFLHNNLPCIIIQLYLILRPSKLHCSTPPSAISTMQFPLPGL